MYFEVLLDILLGEREIIDEVDCSVCGFYETYYRHPITKQTLGRACKQCDFVQTFD